MVVVGEPVAGKMLYLFYAMIQSLIASYLLIDISIILLFYCGSCKRSILLLAVRPNC